LVDVTCYVQPGKAKSQLLCGAFAAGVRAAGGDAAIQMGPCEELRPGAAVFYGVRPEQQHLLEQAKAQGRDWYYIDNAYFDRTREVYFRITRNRLQHDGSGESDGARFAAIGQRIKPPRRDGTHVLVCPQSDQFMRLFCEEGARWCANTVARLKALTARPVRVRPWRPNKVEWYKTLPEDLTDCWALVTYSSASAITAMLEGIPAFVTAADCIARPVANTDLEAIEAPACAPDLLPWAGVVADHQFSLDEIAGGFAWRRLRDGG
jgi:hypothetical protein